MLAVAHPWASASYYLSSQSLADSRWNPKERCEDRGACDFFFGTTLARLGPPPPPPPASATPLFLSPLALARPWPPSSVACTTAAFLGSTTAPHCVRHGRWVPAQLPHVGAVRSWRDGERHQADGDQPRRRLHPDPALLFGAGRHHRLESGRLHARLQRVGVVCAVHLLLHRQHATSSARGT